MPRYHAKQNIRLEQGRLRRTHVPRFPAVKSNIPLAHNGHVHQQILDNDIRLQISLKEFLAEETSTIGPFLRILLQAEPDHLEY